VLLEVEDDMRWVTLAIGLVLFAAAGDARAADPVPSAAPAPPASSPAPVPSAAPAPVAAPTGLAVVALPGAADAAWPLAQAVYAETSLHPPSVDDAHARALCGEAPAPAAPADVRDLADTVAALRGDDAPTRMLLGGIAHRFGVKGLLVVRVDAAHPTPDATVFLAETGTFDAATYAPDAAAPSSPGQVTWSGATKSLVRAFGESGNAAPAGASAPQVAAPALATHEATDDHGTTPSRAFYESGWFWGALGVAALAAGAVFFATRDTSNPTIHLQAQVPAQ
jgi:hypothetical protein